jgi:hypothetical protein
MGFTESAYPDLQDNVKAKVPESGEILEDDIVTTILEEIISGASKPVASGSGMERETIPGAWA